MRRIPQPTTDTFQMDSPSIVKVPKELAEHGSRVVRSVVEWSERVAEPYQIGPRVFPTFALDGANAFRKAVAQVFGTEERGLAIPPSLFSNGQPPQKRVVEIQILWYRLSSGELVSQESLSEMKLLDLWLLGEGLGITGFARTPNHQQQPEMIQAIIERGTLEEVSNSQLQVPWGSVAISNEDSTPWGMATLEETHDGLFEISIVTKAASSEKADELMAEIERQFKYGSIYKNRIYNWNHKTFVQPSYTAERKLVLNSLAEDQKRGAIVHRLKYVDKVMTYYPSLARANALEFGDYGGGKSLSHAADMWYALRCGWTVIQWSPSSDEDRKSYGDIIKFATNLDTPVLILVEDFETMLPKTGDGEEFRGLLDLMDNATNKHLPLITIWTTNFPDVIPPGIWRRFSFAMEFTMMESAKKYEEFLNVFMGRLDRVCPAYVVEEVMPTEEEMEFSISWLAEKLFEAKSPNWLVAKAVESATCYALPQPTNEVVVTPKNVWVAFNSLKPLWERFASADELKAIQSLETILGELIKQRIVEVVEQKLDARILK